MDANRLTQRIKLEKYVECLRLPHLPAKKLKPKTRQLICFTDQIEKVVTDKVQAGKGLYTTIR